MWKQGISVVKEWEPSSAVWICIKSWRPNISVFLIFTKWAVPNDQRDLKYHLVWFFRLQLNSEKVIKTKVFPEIDHFICFFFIKFYYLKILSDGAMKDSDRCIFKMQIHNVLCRCPQLVNRCQYLHRDLKCTHFFHTLEDTKSPSESAWLTWDERWLDHKSFFIQIYLFI